MKRELGIAKCGLACCLCAQQAQCGSCEQSGCPGNDWCENQRCAAQNGLSHCYLCAEECTKGMLAKIKPYAFTLFLKRYGQRALLDCLEANEKKGIVYHREGIYGDYDDFDDAEALVEFIRTGERQRGER